MTSGFLPRAALQTLIDVLGAQGYRCVGPQVRDGAIVYDQLTSVAQLPRGVRDRQAPGHYRLDAHDSPRCFAWANGPQALKPYTFAPQETLWRVQRAADGSLQFAPVEPPAPRLAVIGVRACDLAALALQDRHFLGGAAGPDPQYAARRAALFLVAVHCTHSAPTCFCASTGDGPRAGRGFDLALGEHDDGYVLEAGSARGEEVAAALPLAAVPVGVQQRVDRDIHHAAVCQTRRLPGDNLRDRLFGNLAHPRWQDVGARCLSCGNCTSVCPTCFCHRDSEAPALAGTDSEHGREWDSCFTAGHSYVHGLTIRADATSRYRQWLVHKLGAWHDQYGRSGCVGCGRCISWCPVGIDITDEAAAIAGGDGG